MSALPLWPRRSENYNGVMKIPARRQDSAKGEALMETKTFTSASAAKFIKRLENEKARLVSLEGKSSTYVLAQGEECDPPAYDYREIVERIDELDETIRRIRHALHLFNAQTVIPDEGITVDEALIKLAQMNSNLRRLERLREVEPKTRLESGMFGGKGMIEYQYANFDTKEAFADYEELYRRISDLQLGLDLVNQTETFTVELDEAMF